MTFVSHIFSLKVSRFYFTRLKLCHLVINQRPTLYLLPMCSMSIKIRYLSAKLLHLFIATTLPTYKSDTEFSILPPLRLSSWQRLIAFRRLFSLPSNLELFQTKVHKRGNFRPSNSRLYELTAHEWKQFIKPNKKILRSSIINLLLSQESQGRDQRANL